jgi:glycosyltransferase involved in cell wall biosynthesis
LHIDGYDRDAPVVELTTGPALSVGRSGRDCALLTRVFAAHGRLLRIVCDAERTLAGGTSAPKVTILRHCYDDDYVSELRGAGVVVVPLAVDDISAGQMVILQAMAYRKPIVATRTPTIDDYLTDGVDALLMSPGGDASLQAALDRLIAEPALATRPREQACAGCEARHSMCAFVQHLVQAVGEREAAARRTGLSPMATPR